LSQLTTEPGLLWLQRVALQLYRQISYLNRKEEFNYTLFSTNLLKNLHILIGVQN